jgi:hypothetical protein
MTQVEQIEIPLSKRKMFFIFLGGIFLTGCGVCCLGIAVVELFRSEELPEAVQNDWFFGLFSALFLSYMFIIGLVGVLFFGFGTIIVYLKLFDTKPGLIINRQGIIDYANAPDIVVLWSDIEQITVSKVGGHRFLMIIVKNPQDYIEQAKNPLAKKMVEMCIKMFGTPIGISTSSLQIKFDDLWNLLNEKMNEYKS